ncbi:MAG: hypothetical protein KY391_03790 [Actinobacteria bacterium]|nr:hypothetical protein [Actinomycetota bacterium]
MQQERVVPDWGVKPERPRGIGHHVQRAIVLLIFIGVAFALTFAVGPIWGFAPVFMINIGIGLAAFWWVNNQGLLALRSVGATRCSAEQEPRVWNIARGLASDMRIKPPVLYVIEDGGPNSMTCMARGPALAFTKSLLTAYTRTELEAVIAHGLVRLASGTIDRAMLSVALGPLGTKSLPAVGGADDVHACAVTRYPPALADAIEKAEPRSGRFASFWFVATGGGHRARDERVAAIRDL